MAESVEHRKLKRLARFWLKQEKCDAVACEIRLPLSNFRVDVAGYRSLKSLSGEPGTTFAIECKQSRSDFLRDAGNESSIVSNRDASMRRISKLRDLLAMHLPHCRLYDSLFAEYDTYDFSGWRHDVWFTLNAEYMRLSRRVRKGLKFDKVVRYGCARYCYLVVSENVIRSESELPLGWGCLEAKGGRLVVLRNALRLETTAAARLKLLERIARAMCRLKKGKMGHDGPDSDDAAIVGEVNQFPASNDRDHPLAGENARDEGGYKAGQ